MMLVAIGQKLSSLGTETNPASCTMGTGSFPGVKRQGHGVDHPPPSSAEVEGRIELHIYLPFVVTDPRYMYLIGHTQH